MRNMESLVHPRSDASEIRLKAFVLGFLGLLCAMTIGFVSEIRLLDPDAPDYGYDEALGTDTSSLPSASFLSNHSNDGPATAGASRDGLDRLSVNAAPSSPTAKLQPATGGRDVE